MLYIIIMFYQSDNEFYSICFMNKRLPVAWQSIELIQMLESLPTKSNVNVLILVVPGT